MSNSTNGSNSTFTFSWNLGNGFIEIAALTSLIGSQAAQTLALGSRGPVGLVWATMTIFGGMSVVKGAVSALAPGWMRDMLGVRSPEADAAVGLSLNLDGKGSRYRNRAGVAIGVECQLRVDRSNVATQVGRRDLHILTQRTLNVLKTIPPSGPGDNLRIYSYYREPYGKETATAQFWVDVLCLALSTVKIAEVLLLRLYGALMLSWVTLGTWLTFFLLGSVLFAHHHLGVLGQIRRRRIVDIVVSEAVPVPTSRGGFRKVVLGIPTVERNDVVWKVVWGLSAVSSITSVLLTYMALGNTPSSKVFLIWTGFQIMWIGLRSMFYHMIDDRERPYHPSLEGKTWEKLGFQEKVRVRNLVHSLARYQYHVHPRGSWSYKEDSNIMPSLGEVCTRYPISLKAGAVVDLSVDHIVGDTMLSSAAWMFGSENGGFDFYDSCLVLLKVNGRQITIPAARVLSGVRPAPESDSEKADEIERPPRGGTNRGYEIDWWFWIPCDSGWLHFHSDDLKFKGSRKATVLTDDQVTERLKAGQLYVSLKDVDDVKDIVKSSQVGCNYIRELTD